MRKIIHIAYWGLVICLSCLSIEIQAQQAVNIAYIDSLNNKSYESRYKDLTESANYAGEAYSLSEEYPVGRAQALNNLGFISFMRMDFEQATRLFQKVYICTENQLECLIADIGLMKITQRTSQNKMYYDYSNRARVRIANIQEVLPTIQDESLRKRFYYALSEYYIVNSIYYFYLEQIAQSIDALKQIKEESLENIPAQRLYYLYVKGSGGLSEGEDIEKIVVQEFEMLVECLLLAKKGDYTYFEANALQGLAELLIPFTHREILQKKTPMLLRLLNDGKTPLEEQPLQFAEKALQLFTEYGDWYQSSGCYRTMATYYNYHQNPEMALSCLAKSLSFANKHHQKYYQPIDSLDYLQTYSPYRHNVSTELEWIKREVKTIPEWIARIREQLSLTYSALGRKTESDYNRNIYLDLLDYTRQDKELESRKENLEQKEALISKVLTGGIVGFLSFVSLLVLLNYYQKKRNQRYSYRLHQVLKLGQQLIEALPTSIDEYSAILTSIEQVLQKELPRIFETKDICLSQEEKNSLQAQELVFPLQPQDQPVPIGFLYITTIKTWKKEDQALVQLFLPYLIWTLENGLRWAYLETEKQRLETEEYINTQHLIENKYQNATKKACIFIASGIQPYIDRIIHQIDKLRTASYAQNEEVKQGKLSYIQELIDKINEYNEILATWIKIKKGDLSLHIETFNLKDVFEIVAKGKRTFENKQQTLEVTPTDFMVKADRALTFFMINTLLENAHKYTPEGGRIRLYTEEFDQYIEISITDTGIGLSSEDIQTILGEKVYESQLIGINQSTDTQALKAQKGHGFGLINCKGIIEKYKKTNPLFSVCHFGIESTLKQGSRFFFRLPKGIKRTLLGGLIACITLGGSSCSTEPRNAHTQRNPFLYDSLFSIANVYANKMYNENMKGEYEQALIYADSVILFMNEHHLLYNQGTAPLLELEGNPNQPITEIEWFKRGYDTDYHILLDLRNEAAVAALALKDFSLYRYNNKAYTMLYKQISQDTTLEDYCLQMEQTSKNKSIAIFFCVAFSLCAGLIFYLLYIRRNLRMRYNLEQVLQVNKKIFSTSPVDAQEEEEKVQLENILATAYNAINQVIPIGNMAFCIKDEETTLQLVSQTEITEEEKEQICKHAHIKTAFVDKNTHWAYFPLNIAFGKESTNIGTLAVYLPTESNTGDCILFITMVSRYLALYIYHTVIKISYKSSIVEIAQDDVSRIHFEQGLIHVQNMVLDNCLSTLKHETLYYPHRIKQIIAKSELQDDTSTYQEALMNISEVVTHYKEVFGLLLSCAERQLENVTFRRGDVSTYKLIQYAEKYSQKLLKKADFNVYLHTEIEEDMTAIGDEVLLNLLIECLLHEAIAYPKEGNLSLHIYREDKFIRFDFTDERREMTQEEANQLFYPQQREEYHNGSILSQGFEWLICKQVIREHDEYASRRGCRINACPAEKGFKIWFTIPIK